MAKQPKKKKNTSASSKNKKTTPSSSKKTTSKTNKTTTSSFTFYQKYWTEKSSVFKFLAGFALCVIVFYAMYYSAFFQDYMKQPILRAQTSVGAGILNLFGFSVMAMGDVISGAGTSVKVAGGCDGLEATALLLAAIFVFPLPFKYKWPGLVAGLIVLGVLNVIRIAGLYLVKVYWPNAFEFMHIQGGLYLFSFVTILLMLIWANWALKGYKQDLVAAKA